MAFSSHVSDLDIRGLTSLLSLSEEDDDDIEASRTRKRFGTDLTPATITGLAASTKSGSNVSESDGYRRSTNKEKTSRSDVAARDTTTESLRSLLGDIWETDEVKLGHCVEPADPRPSPKYEINYRQRVTANQVYLPISSLTSSISGEEDIVISVVLPGDELTEVNLEVTSTNLRLASPNHLLNLPLPRQVDQRKGVATWDPNTHTLVVTIPTVHDVQPLLKPVRSSR